MIEFRRNALKKLNAPDELDAPVRLAAPRSWVLIVTAVALVLAGGVWTAVAELPRAVSAAGVLTHEQGSFVLRSPVAGQVTGLLVEEGGAFGPDTPVLTIQTRDRTETVRSVTGGRITALFGEPGQIVAAGTELAVVERIDHPTDALVAVLYVPAADASLIRPDREVDLSVQSAPAQEYGVLRGRVRSVGRFAESRKQIADFLGDDELAERFASAGQPLKVVVRLTEDRTTSGYRWSTADGPPFRIDSRTPVTGAVRLAPIRPIDLVVT